MNKLFFGLYGIFLLAFVIFSYVFIDPNFIYLNKIYSDFLFRYRLSTTLIYILFICFYFIFYFLILRRIFLKKINSAIFNKLIFITIFILFFAYPAILSYDIFNYILTAKVLFFYRENPYVVMPITFIRDPLLLFTHAANKIALYGPIWILLTAIPYYLANFINFLFVLFSFKLFVVLFYLGTILIIWKLSASLFSIALFALNPLVVIETLISGHNDIAMMFFALLSFFLVSKNKIAFAFLFLLLSILIKYSTLFLVPIFLYVLWKKIKKKELNWDHIFFISSISMLIAFLLSPIREEIYPWYAVWFIPFVSLIPKHKILLYGSLSICFGLLLYYVPFMLLGTYSGPTPFLKLFMTFTPVGLTLLFIVIKEKLWLRFFR